MYCVNCGSKLPDGCNFCVNCGAPVHSSENKVRCPRCGSENVHIQAKKAKFPLALGLGLLFGGLGLIFLGVIGNILGFVVGGVIGAVVNAFAPTAYESVMVCQSCGYTAEKKG